MNLWTIPAGVRPEDCTFEPLMPSIARRFYGSPPARTMRGYAVMAGGEPIAIVGLLRDPYRWVLFSEASEAARGDGAFSARRLVVLGVRKLQEMLDGVAGPVQAMADDRYEGAQALLERLGFERMTQGVYQWRKPQHSSRPH